MAREFSRVYTATQMPDLASAAARWARATSTYMTLRGSPAGIKSDWVFIAELLDRVAATYYETNSPTELPGDSAADPGAQIYTLDYRALGEVVPESLLARLHRATIAVEQSLTGQGPDNPLTDDEIILLRGLIAGRSINDLAADLGYSERSISRLLRSIWDRVGATSRAEGIATITAQGWLGVPISTNSR